MSRRSVEQPLIAFYFSLLLFYQEWPVLIGPYETWEECASVREMLDRRGYETDDCTLLPVEQEARKLEVIDIP